MAEIGSTSSISHWPRSRVVNSTNDSGQSPKKQYQEDKQDDDVQPVSVKKKYKKSPPGNNMNSHIDEYA